MADSFMGEIRMVAFTYAPQGWATCDGQLLPINQNQPLFSLLGTNFGGDGYSTFALPDFRSRGPIHQGQGHGLSERVIGEALGAEAAELPSAKTEIPQSPDNPTVLAYAPGAQPVESMPPFLVVTFIISLTGQYPPR
jgi:microcystin-dependent protein